MIEFLKGIDVSLFFWINSKHNAFFDTVMHYASHDYFWAWFYAILLGLLIMIYKKRTAIIVLIVVLMIVVSDQSANLFKNVLFKRYRPCHNLELEHVIHVNGNCGGQYGFVSSHASNTFALALFMSLLLVRRYRFMPMLLFLWAAFVSYSRIYNGVHYPADVLGGAVLGIFSGCLAWQIWKYSDVRFMQKNVT